LAGTDAGASKIERDRSGREASSVKTMLVAKKAMASPAVTRVRKLAAPRPVMKPPPPPMPSAPPSERCSSTTPTSAEAIMRWRMSRTVVMGNASGSTSAVPLPALLHQPSPGRQSAAVSLLGS
jgi:hypothetical protein